MREGKKIQKTNYSKEAKKLLTKGKGSAIISLPLIEGSFFVPFKKAKKSPGGRCWRPCRQIHGRMSEYTGGTEQ